MQENSPDPQKIPQQAEKAGKVPVSFKEEEQFNVPVTGIPSSEMDAKLSDVRKILDLGSAEGSPITEVGNAPKEQAPAPISIPHTDEKPRSWIRRILG